EIWVANYDGLEWEMAGTATVSGGGISSDEGSGLSHLSTLLLAIPGDSSSGEDTGSGTDDSSASLGGSLVDENGDPITNARVQLCSTNCQVLTPGDDGSFLYENLDAATYAFDVVILDE
ncbi:MAG: hypothetical protein QGG40_21185, partial [Myxococcota bacterium]|nr:hypothetical protein [Myxococcota bacterium]